MGRLFALVCVYTISRNIHPTVFYYYFIFAYCGDCTLLYEYSGTATAMRCAVLSCAVQCGVGWIMDGGRRCVCASGVVYRIPQKEESTGAPPFAVRFSQGAVS